MLKELDSLMVKAKFEKPWFYERVDDLNSAYTLMASFGLLALLALFWEKLYFIHQFIFKYLKKL